MINTINNYIDQARRNQDSENLTFYSTLKSDCQRAMKSMKDEITDDVVIAVCKQWKKALEENAGIASETDNLSLLKECKAELVKLYEFLPKEMSDDNLIEIVATEVDRIKEEGLIPTLGMIMKYLKTHYSNQYDSHRATEIIKDIIERS